MVPGEAPARADQVLRGGSVIDGSGQARYRADVAIDKGRIAAIGDLGRTVGTIERDVTGLIVAPGFIDVHTHDDGLLLVDPAMSPKASQGVTSVVIGNCGFSLAPLLPKAVLPQEFRLLGEDSIYRYPTMERYFAALEKTPPATHVAALVGHSTLRMGALRDLDRAATPAECAAMSRALDECLGAGAIGFSTGLEYPTNTAASTEEIVAVAEPLAAHGGLYVTHTRDYVDDIDGAMEEAFEIGRRAKAPVVLSHHQGDGKKNHGHAARTLARYDRAARAQPVGLDVYPYTAGSTTIMPEFVAEAERVLITWSDAMPQAAGRDLDDIARELELDRQEAAQRLLPGGAIYFVLDEGDVRRILAHPDAMIGSDGLPFGRKVHPRLWGTFPRVLGHYAREQGLFTLEEAVRKMTSLSAARFGLEGRGRITPGFAADLVVFDAGRIIDRATYDDPTRPAAGIDCVLVAGEAVWDGGRPTGARPGRVLRHGRA
ncbi:MAG TPA: D-aminoacylase [Hypericibacter adhaerens]|jgi:N-acyl-D-amino-acid deacylase|uniref:N-acyl-D-amino-acid deacylase family protein n=1 Tax=Hypericibacter adhaerens TaxID=2602016 RepID=UPI0012491AB3|nr:D-aminoacylase [Hypericibacter adhaerens]HWA43533.1 D-aminoacylase [Hypericibacter adhaerens]